MGLLRWLSEKSCLTPNAQILVFHKYCSPVKGPRLLGEMAAPWADTGNTQDFVVPESTKVLKHNTRTNPLLMGTCIGWAFPRVLVEVPGCRASPPCLLLVQRVLGHWHWLPLRQAVHCVCACHLGPSCHSCGTWARGMNADMLLLTGLAVSWWTKPFVSGPRGCVKQ